MISRIAIEGYRSLRQLRTTIAPLTVITGANGAGKSSFYRALRLLADVGQDAIIASVAREGGLDSIFWAGPEKGAASMIARGVPVQGTVRKGPLAVKLGFSSHDIGYAIDLGVPSGGDAFPRDPVIKAEAVWHGGALSRHSVVAERKGPLVRLRSPDGAMQDDSFSLPAWASMLTNTQALDGEGLLRFARDTLRQWRFYDGLRTDAQAPARQPAVATRTPVLAADGGDLGPAIATIFDIGDGARLQDAIGEAFDGASIELADLGQGLSVSLRQPGLLRAMTANELSDGTLRYLLLMAALFSPRPPSLLVLNEPEASLHPQLLAPLATQTLAASKLTQVVVISHAQNLTQRLVQGGAALVNLSRQHGETVIDDDDPPNWIWPSR